MIVALQPCRNEGWCLGLTLRALLQWVDAAVVLDHCSTDETRDILAMIEAENPHRLKILREDNPVWEEMRHRQRTLDAARELGATHAVLIDSDEILTGELLPDIRRMVLGCPPAATMELPWLCLRDSIDRVHVDGVWGEQNISCGFVDNPALHWSSAGRAGYDFHARPPMGRGYSPYRPIKGRQSGLMHLQFVNARRLRAKQALYQTTEVLRWPGRETPDQIRKKYSLSVYGRDHGPAIDFGLADCPPEWLAPYAHLMRHYRPDATPWQEIALRALFEEHGSAKFDGLDLFGVV